jgi:hypothetical protein
MTINRGVCRVSLAMTDLVLACFLIGLDVVARQAPHAPNFTPVAASALFAGAVLSSRMLAFIVPLAAMALADCTLGFYDWNVMVVVYAAIAMPAALGVFARRSATPSLVLPLAVTSSVIFYIATNWAVWMFSGSYARDTGGLLKCYVAAIPFFKNTLMGDLFWTASLFGLLWTWRSARRRLQSEAYCRPRSMSLSRSCSRPFAESVVLPFAIRASDCSPCRS